MNVQDAYEQISQYYDDHRDRSPYFKVIEGITRRCFLENTQNKKFDRGLDVGCGTGRNLPLYLDHCNRVEAMDYTPGMLKHAQSRLAGTEPLSLLLGDMQYLPFQSEQFDLVGCFKALPHVPDVPLALSELFRVARPGATVFIEFYSPWSFRRLLTPMKHHTLWHPVKKARRLLERTGFRVQQVYGLRTFMAAEVLCYLPGAHALFDFLENRYTNSSLNRFSGYYIVVCEKPKS